MACGFWRPRDPGTPARRRPHASRARTLVSSSRGRSQHGDPIGQVTHRQGRFEKRRRCPTTPRSATNPIRPDQPRLTPAHLNPLIAPRNSSTNTGSGQGSHPPPAKPDCSLLLSSALFCSLLLSSALFCSLLDLFFSLLPADLCALCVLCVFSGYTPPRQRIHQLPDTRYNTEHTESTEISREQREEKVQKRARREPEERERERERLYVFECRASPDVHRTKRRTPSFKSLTLKLMSKPMRHPENLR